MIKNGLIIGSLVIFSVFAADVSADWPMAGANPERTSWVPEGVSGNLRIEWCRPVEAFISQNVNLIAANDKIYVATAKGLYALNALGGGIVWRFDTQIPLGNAPTVSGNRIYVPGLDKNIYALDDSEGAIVWTFGGAEAGFSSNPLVVDGVLYAGCRDGFFYALDADDGSLLWRYPDFGGDRLDPIDLSAAYKDGVIYFASQDCYAYALDTGGNLVWKSAGKMPGPQYQSWWPVIYRDKVVFAGANPYRSGIAPGAESTPTGGGYNRITKDDVWPEETYPTAVYIGPEVPGYSEPWAHGRTVLDGSRICEYLEDNPDTSDPHIHKPWRRTTVILNRSDGTEYTTDVDTDGFGDYAPLAWVGTNSGQRYPPIVNGNDDVIYQVALSGRTSGDFGMVRHNIFGWKIGTKYLSVINSEDAGDEPTAISSGGDIIYKNLCCCRLAVWRGLASGSGSLWHYSNPIYDLVDVPGNNQQVVGLDVMWWGRSHLSGLHGNFGNHNGIYHDHGDQNPVIPYNGRVYVHRSNAVICYGPGAKTDTPLPILEMDDNRNDATPIPTKVQVLSRLEEEIQKIVDAGNLNPGYYNLGQWYYNYLQTHFENPGDTLMTLCRAYPHVNPTLQAQLAAYLQNQFSEYFNPTMYARKGWTEGVPRDWMDYPKEVADDMLGENKKTSTTSRTSFSYPPHNFYAMALYAEIFPGQALTAYNRAKSKLQVPCPGSNNTILNEYRYEINMYITGYTGFLKLQEAAGMSGTDASLRTQVQNELNRLLQLRADHFTKDSPFVNADKTLPAGRYQNRPMNISSNFLFMCPELGDYLNQNIYNKAADAVKEYNWVGAYWFVSRYNAAPTEGCMSTLYDYPALFSAKAWILKEPYEELVKYLDAPAFKYGDLFYIDNLIAAIEGPRAAPQISPAGGGIYIDPVTVTISHPVANANIHYTLDGNEPNANSTLYTAAFELTGDTTVKAIAYPEGQASEIATAVFVIDTGMANGAPVADAGPDQVIQLPTDMVDMSGSYADNTLTYPPAIITTSWSIVSAPDSVIFGDADALETTATFGGEGEYILRLTVDENGLIDTDDVTITVQPKPNEAPQVDAGSDRQIILPDDTVNLDGSVTDDGKPDPPGVVTTKWSKVSGTGSVIFGDADAVDTTATFGSADTYVLQLDANDGEYEMSDTVTITVYPPVPPGAVMYLKLDEGGGDTAADSSGRNNDGAIDGAGWAAGIDGNGLSFDGVDDKVTISDSYEFDSAKGTWSLWVKTDGNWGVNGGSSGTTTMGSCVVMDRHGTGANSASGISLLINPAGTVNLQAKNGSTTVANPKSTGTINNNAWHHVAVTWDQSSGGEMLIYIDGNPDGSATNSSVWSFNNQDLLIADSPDSYWEEYAGLIDDVQVYNTALSADDIVYLYNNPGKRKLAGDLNNSGMIDSVDLGILADQWLQSPGTPSADIAPVPTGDGMVDMLDFAEMANQWLNGN